jgi:hypothetical protein
LRDQQLSASENQPGGDLNDLLPVTLQRFNDLTRLTVRCFCK